MLERLIEDWLTNANERSFQKPFCSMLAADGYSVLHLTRHWAMELGKDVVALDPKGRPCAYQLKDAPTGRVGLSEFREKIEPQLLSLVSTKIVHPSFKTKALHRSFLVVNGDLEEDVQHAIDGMNRTWADQKLPYRLETIVRGQLLASAKELGTKLWPSDLADVRDALQLYLADGRGPLPKATLASLLEATLGMRDAPGEKRPSDRSARRLLASAGLLCGVALAGFTRAGNLAAEIDGWTLYASYTMGLACRYDLPDEVVLPSLDLAIGAIRGLLDRLCAEIRERKVLFERDVTSDQFVYPVRMTRLMALMSVHALWRRRDALQPDDVDEFLRAFCAGSKPHLWGEAAVPQFLAIVWYLRTVDPTPHADELVAELISGITQFNGRPGPGLLASPYYEAEDALPHALGVAEEPLEDSFDRTSYTLEALVLVLARQNLRQRLRGLWPGVSRMAFLRFEPARKWHALRFRNEGQGVLRMVVPQRRQSWADLKPAPGNLRIRSCRPLCGAIPCSPSSTRSCSRTASGSTSRCGSTATSERSERRASAPWKLVEPLKPAADATASIVHGAEAIGNKAVQASPMSFHRLNWATALWPWRQRKRQQIEQTPGLLQWGHGAEAVETPGGAGHLAEHLIASMGPRR